MIIPFLFPPDPPRALSKTTGRQQGGFFGGRRHSVHHQFAFRQTQWEWWGDTRAGERLALAARRSRPSSSVSLTLAAAIPCCTATAGHLQLYAGIHGVSAERTSHLWSTTSSASGKLGAVAQKVCVHDDQRRSLARTRACARLPQKAPRHSSGSTHGSLAKTRARLRGRGCLPPPRQQPRQLPPCARKRGCAAAAQSYRNSKICWPTGSSPRRTTWPRSSSLGPEWPLGGAPVPGTPRARTSQMNPRHCASGARPAASVKSPTPPPTFDHHAYRSSASSKRIIVRRPASRCWRPSRCRCGRRACGSRRKTCTKWPLNNACLTESVTSASQSPFCFRHSYARSSTSRCYCT